MSDDIFDITTKKDRTVLHTVLDDFGNTEVYFGRTNDDWEPSYDSSFLFFKDGSLTCKFYKDGVCSVVTIYGNRVLVLATEDQYAFTELDPESLNDRDYVLFDSDRDQPA